jgi:hypothetical protein
MPIKTRQFHPHKVGKLHTKGWAVNKFMECCPGGQKIHLHSKLKASNGRLCGSQIGVVGDPWRPIAWLVTTGKDAVA